MFLLVTYFGLYEAYSLGPVGLTTDSRWLYFTEDGSHTIRKVELPLQSWNVKDHKLFPKKERDIVRCLIMCFGKEGCLLANLPRDILYIVIHLSLVQKV